MPARGTGPMPAWRAAKMIFNLPEITVCSITSPVQPPVQCSSPPGVIHITLIRQQQRGSAGHRSQLSALCTRSTQEEIIWCNITIWQMWMQILCIVICWSCKLWLCSNEPPELPNWQLRAVASVLRGTRLIHKINLSLCWPMATVISSHYWRPTFHYFPDVLI